MSVIINASTSQGLVMTSDLSGTLSLQSNGVAVTVPAVAGTMMVSGNMPAFSAYQAGSAQSLSNATFTKITFDTERFDTNNNFAFSRFTPTIAGYYQINIALQLNGSVMTIAVGSIYKNGTEYVRGAGINFTTGNSSTFRSTAGSVIYLNGSTDYVEAFALISATSGQSVEAYDFSGAMVRTA